MALFCNNQLGFFLNGNLVVLPLDDACVEFFVRFARTGNRLFFFQIVNFAEDEHDDIRILFNRPGFTQVGQKRPLIFAGFDLTAQLGQHDDRDIQLFGHDFQTARDFGQRLDAIFLMPAVRVVNQLKIVNDNQPKTFCLITLQTAGAVMNGADGQARRVVHIQGDFFQI